MTVQHLFGKCLGNKRMLRLQFQRTLVIFTAMSTLFVFVLNGTFLNWTSEGDPNKQVSLRKLQMTNIKSINYVDLFTIYPESSSVTGDFPIGNRKSPLIPHLIHQTHWSTMIPSKERIYVKSVINKNPGWKYHFWTDVTARALIKEKFNSFLPIWDSYEEGIKRGDALRYFVLHEFGGVYMDLDFIAYRNLNQVTFKYSCIIPAEPIEQGIFLYNSSMILNNGIMLCMPKHPYFKHMIDLLHIADTTLFVLEATGPKFVTNAFYSYIKMSAEMDNPLEMKREHDGITFLPRKRSPTGQPLYDIHIPSTVFFNDELGGRKESGYYQRVCMKSNKTVLETIGCNEIVCRGMEQIARNSSTNSTQTEMDHTFLGYRNNKTIFDDVCLKRQNNGSFTTECEKIFKAGLFRSRSKYTFTTHKWFHSWAFRVNIKNVVPRAIFH